MSETKVVHVNSPEWAQAVKDGTAVYIGRAVPRRGFKASFWQNMNRITPTVDRAEAIARYQADVEQSEWHMSRLLELRSKVLGCWCKPEACHGDVLVELIERNV